MYRNYTKKEERVQKEINKRESKRKQIKPSETFDKDTSIEPSAED